MSIKSLTLTLAVGFAAGMLYKSRDSASSMQGVGSESDGLQLDSPPADALSNLSSIGIGSPNGAERLQDRELAGAGVGLASGLADTPDDMFRPTIVTGSDEVHPGLPDFARGA